MRRTTIKNIESLTGFVANGPKKGEMALILQRARVLADEPYFYMFINQIDDHFLRGAKINGDSITNFFVLFHNDGTADVFTGYTEVHIEMKPKRPLAKGEPVYVSDIEDVRSYKIDGIDFAEDDAVVCVMKVGWKYGLFFDFTRSTNGGEVWRQLGRLYNSLHEDRILENIQGKIKEAEKPHFITEGKTDWKHIEAARRQLTPELSFGYPASEDTLGDDRLLKMCEHLSKFGPPNKNKIIAIFDRDNPATLKALAKHGDINKYQAWGNNVYSLAIPIPDNRKDYKYPCIELLYANEDLARKDQEGKRLFFDNEIKKEVIPGGDIRIIAIPPVGELEYEKKVYDELASKIEDNDGNKLGISKAVFAQHVLERTKGYKNVSFDGFKPLFAILKEILDVDPTRE